MAAKPLTKSQIATAVAETAGITKKQATDAIAALVGLAYKNAKIGFTVPGLGKLVLVNRKARMGRNPATGEMMKSAGRPASMQVRARVLSKLKQAAQK